MTIAENIATAVANHKDERLKEILSNMSLDEIASVWSDIHAEHNAPAENKEAQEKDFKEKSDELHKIVTPEKLQSLINEYTEGLSNGSYSPADFTKISEFCNSFNEELRSDAIKDKLDKMKELMQEKRLSMENPITLADDRLAESLRLPELDSIAIEGNKETISALEDKTSSKGKAFSFKGAEDKEMGLVSIDEQGMADITFVNGNNEKQHFQISSNGNITYLPEGQEPQTWTIEELKGNQHARFPDMDYALRLNNASRKIWLDYSNGKLDNAIDKSITVKEKSGGMRISEERDKTTVDESKKNTKVEEETDENASGQTKINEEKSLPQNPGGVNSGTKNENAPPENETYWKEDDIIKVMFEEWFLKAANAVTNWVVHQIEYTVSGIWKEFESAFNARKEKMEEERKEAEKEDNTQKLFKSVQEASKKHVEPLKESSEKKPQKDAIDAVKAGNIDEAIAANKLLQSLGDYADVKTLLSQGTPETTVPFVIGLATMATKFSDDYAQASILNALMNNPEAFKGQNMEEVYAAKYQEAQLILKRQTLDYQQEHPNENPAQAVFKSMKQCTDEMKAARDISITDFNDKRYVEKGKNPRKNEILERYESLVPQQNENSGDENSGNENSGNENSGNENSGDENSGNENSGNENSGNENSGNERRSDEPTSLPEEANRRESTDNDIDAHRNDMRQEEANLDAREQEVQNRRRAVERTRSNTHTGSETTREAENTTQQQPQVTSPTRPRGREI